MLQLVFFFFFTATGQAQTPDPIWGTQDSEQVLRGVLGFEGISHPLDIHVISKRKVGWKRKRSKVTFSFHFKNVDGEKYRCISKISFPNGFQFQNYSTGVYRYKFVSCDPVPN